MDAVVADSHPAARGSVACRAPDLVCPAGSLPALKAAVDHGATCVYTGFRDATNARNFAGLNFSSPISRSACATRAIAACGC